MARGREPRRGRNRSKVPGEQTGPAAVVTINIPRPATADHARRNGPKLPCGNEYGDFHSIAFRKPARSFLSQITLQFERRNTLLCSLRLAGIPYYDAYRGWVEVVARIVDLGTIGDDEKHVHVRGNVDVISGSRDAIDNRKSSRRLDRHTHEEVQVCDDVALGQSMLRQLKNEVFAACVLIPRRLPEAGCIAFARTTTG